MNDTILTAQAGRDWPAIANGRFEEEPVMVERVRGARRQTQEERPLVLAWFDAVSDSCLVTDLMGLIDEANRAAALLLGVRKEFLLGKPLGLFMAKESRSAFYSRLACLNEHKNGVERWEACISPQQGCVREVMLTVAAFADDHGVKLHWIIRDIADLRAAQRHALQAERLAAIGQMAAGLGHEGRNALQRIQACTAILNLRLQDRPEDLDLLGRIQRAQDDLQRLFEDVRNYAIAPQLKRMRYDLRESWREAWNELANRPEWASAELHEAVAGVDPFCRVDSFYLKHVFRNLLENALTCGANPVRIVIHCREASLRGREAICLRLRDNGPGIPAEARSHLFEPFCTTKASGTGLGLAICKRIIEAHGGQIEASGDSASGAEIIITLPRKAT